ncbi:MAG: alkene reductase [Burkholderiales bacterium]|nr:alkene reductase [Burkholderiales bacterium]
MPNLFDPIHIGDLDLANRLVMAPLTRNRAGQNQVPTDLMVTYYEQRANPATGAGLIVSEATQISPQGQGYLDTPGIYSAEQVAGWRKVTDAVHAQGGKIVVQLWHVGRISHTSLQPGGAAPLAPSAIQANTKTFTAKGFEPVSAPRALTLEELPGIVDQYRRAARNAITAGFDGVEVHGANGYLLDQFLRDGSNHRTDAYGGSIQNRARLLIEVMQAVVDEIGAKRTAIRISPVTPSNDAHDSNPQALFNHVAEQLDKLQLLYVHVIEGETGGKRDIAPFDYEALHHRVHAPWMVNNGYSLALADDVLNQGGADLVAFGRPFIGNPDLGRRLRDGVTLNALNPATLYGGGAAGYTDYPAMS